MRFLNTQLSLVTILIIGLAGISYATLTSDPCYKPLRYSIGNLDPQFNIATSTIRELLVEAESLWEEQAGRELFVYDPESSFTVNFIFDERQRTTNAVNDYELVLADLEMSHDEVAQLYEERKSRYQKALSEYHQHLNDYEVSLRDYNQRVSEWNDSGGAPPEVYSELQMERDRLDEWLKEIEVEQRQLESLRQDVNELVTEGNRLAREYNEKSSTFIERFGEAREFDQATYHSDRINVYQFEGKDDLRLALAHEFGHALGIGHVSNPESLMYYLMKDQSLNDLELTSEDVAALNNVCDYE